MENPITTLKQFTEDFEKAQQVPMDVTLTPEERDIVDHIIEGIGWCTDEYVDVNYRLKFTHHSRLKVKITLAGLGLLYSEDKVQQYDPTESNPPKDCKLTPINILLSELDTLYKERLYFRT